VEQIYMPEGYYGLYGLYAEDIAVIVLKKNILFSNGIAPVCVDWNNIYNVNNGDQGKVNMLYYIICNFIKYIEYNLKLEFWFSCYNVISVMV